MYSTNIIHSARALRRGDETRHPPCLSSRSCPESPHLTMFVPLRGTRGCACTRTKRFYFSLDAYRLSRSPPLQQLPGLQERTDCEVSAVQPCLVSGLCSRSLSASSGLRPRNSHSHQVMRG